MRELILGLDTFGDVREDDSGQPLSHAAAIRQVVEEAVLADEIGVDFIALGEHHRPEFSISTPETVLAGIATRTSRIQLSSGVTVLSSDDPVRVFQRFSTVDALSNGRGHPRPRLVHRVVPSVRLRPKRPSSKKNSNCSPGCSTRSPSHGAAHCVRRWKTPTSTPRRSQVI
jgi:hypothetical protein